MFYKLQDEYFNEIRKQEDLTYIFRDLFFLENKIRVMDFKNLNEDDKKFLMTYKDCVSILQKKFTVEDRLEFESPLEDFQPKSILTQKDFKDAQSLFDKIIADRNSISKKIFFRLSDKNLKLLERLQKNLINYDNFNEKIKKKKEMIEKDFYISPDGRIWSSESAYLKSQQNDSDEIFRNSVSKEINFDISEMKKKK